MGQRTGISEQVLHIVIAREEGSGDCVLLRGECSNDVARPEQRTQGPTGSACAGASGADHQ
eukprot:4220377-Alexandrium_andersonii.AAC.1